MRFYCSNGVWNLGDGKPIPVAPLQRAHSNVIPMEVAEEAYKEYSAQFGRNQTLERLNERGGFGAEEIAILLFERIKRIEKSQK